MQMRVNTKVYKELKKTPLFFVKFNKEKIIKDEYGRKCIKPLWESVNSDYPISFPAEVFENRANGYCLCLVEKGIPVKKEDSHGNTYIDENQVNMVFHDVSNSVQDYYICLERCFRRSQNKEDKYYYLEILWLLDKVSIDVSHLTEAINKYDTRFIPYILNILQQIGRCLSVEKQKSLKEVCTSLNGQYDVYIPQMLTEAVRFLQNDIEPDKKNLFQLIDGFFERELNALNEVGETNNPLLQLVCWFSNEKKLADYNILIPLFTVVPKEIRLNIVKRYFHDIRHGNTTFNVQLLQQFVDNEFDDFIRYRYCTETPSDKVNLTEFLLCDSIVTLYNSNGGTFQTFDGVLDYVITHCDPTHPYVDFDFPRIIPTCEHGAVYNKDFNGFIDYQLIRKLDTSKLSDEYLLATIRKILDRYCYRQTYLICKFDNNKKIETTTLEKCKSAFSNKTTNGSSQLSIQCAILTRAGVTNNSSQPSNAQCPGMEYKLYEDKWFFGADDEKKEILQTFMTYFNFSSSNGVDYSNVDIRYASVDKLRKYVNSLPQKFQMVDEGEFLVSSYTKKTYDLLLIETLSEILRVRINPQKGALVGKEYDVFGYWKEISATLSDYDKQNRNGEAYRKALSVFKEKESNEVYRRTVASLKKELKTNEYNGEYFELKYDEQQFNKLKSRYYFKKTFQVHDDEKCYKFLTLSSVDPKPYCAPTLSETNNPVIDLPFFWCRGKECFHNNLEKQTLAEQNDWHFYSLYHMVEIIGFPKLHMTPGGYEPDKVIRGFIAVVNKVKRMFERLKCRGCGHLLFTDKSSGFNRRNYYSCINPNCPKVRIPVYLNYCFRCKTGLIDSRDNQQCPNHWYICPTCLACCDDAQYERLAQRYRIVNRPVPEFIARMLNHGHNNNGEYFCPYCGGPVVVFKGRRDGKEKRVCYRCNKVFYEYRPY